MSLLINEIFYSIQGESSFAGYPCVFIRLTGCNLRCSYCDTRYAFDAGHESTIRSIIDRVSSFKCRLVEITGGEPLFQGKTPALIKQLLDLGYNVLLETNGSMDVGKTDNRCIRIMDIKCPSSGEAEQNDLANIGKLTFKDEIKFVIGDRDDFLYARKMLRMINKGSHVAQISFSPVSGQLLPSTLASWMLKDGIKARLNLQIHKIIWPSDKQGV